MDKHNDQARLPISGFIVCYNEETHIARAISSMASFDEVVVVDSGSTDKTVEIASRLGARVIHNPWPGYAMQKAFALQHCQNEWCMNIDADEEVSPDLIGEMAALLHSAPSPAYKIRINDLIAGQRLHRWSRKRAIVRLFKKQRITYPTDRSVHENVIVDGQVGWLKNQIIHYGYSDVLIYFLKHVNYAGLRAKDKRAAGSTGSVTKLCIIAPLVFFKVFLLRGLFFSGWRGLIVALTESFYAFAKEAALVAGRSKYPDG